MLKNGDEFLIIRKAIVSFIHEDKSICFNWKDEEKIEDNYYYYIDLKHAIPLDSIEYKAEINIGDKIFDDEKNEFVEIELNNLNDYIDGDYLVIKSSKVKLKKCPICKKIKSLKILRGDDIGLMYNGLPKDFVIICDGNKGGCGLSSGASKSKEDVVNRWNKR